MKNKIFNFVAKCPFCGKINNVEVPEKGYTDWQDGKMIQYALPNLTADERELLMTGICSDCFPKE